jgi:hypothetical protein
MNNPVTLATLGTQDTGRRQTKQIKKNTENWKDEQHGPHQKQVMKSGAREGHYLTCLRITIWSEYILKAMPSYWVREWSNIIEGNVCKYGYYVNMDIMSNFVSLHTNYTEMKGIRSICNVYCWIMIDTETQKWKIKGFTIKFCTVLFVKK